MIPSADFEIDADPDLCREQACAQARSTPLRARRAGSSTGFRKTASMLAQILRLERRGRQQLNLVDCMSFVVMEMYGITAAFAYDSDFETEGFTLVN